MRFGQFSVSFPQTINTRNVISVNCLDENGHNDPINIYSNDPIVCPPTRAKNIGRPARPRRIRSTALCIPRTTMVNPHYRHVDRFFPSCEGFNLSSLFCLKCFMPIVVSSIEEQCGRNGSRAHWCEFQKFRCLAVLPSSVPSWNAEFQRNRI